MLNLHMRLFPRVYHLVKFQGICVCKGFSTNIANIWPFIRMNSIWKTNIHYINNCENLSNNIPMMFIASRKVSKCCWTITAFIWTIPSVSIHMSRQLLCLCEAVSTNPIVIINFINIIINVIIT